MENQHKKISGYRELAQEEIDLINRIKAQGLGLEEICSFVARQSAADSDPVALAWALEARTRLQIGLMLLTRAVARPEGF